MRHTFSNLKMLRVIALQDDGNKFSCVPCFMNRKRAYFFATHIYLGNREETKPVRMNVDFVLQDGVRVTRACFVYHIGAHYYADADINNFVTVAEHRPLDAAASDTVMLRHRALLTARRIGSQV